MKNGLLRILNDLDSAGRGRKRDEEDGRSDVEGGAMRRVKKNEKLPRGRIVVLLILGSWSLSAESLVGPGSVEWSIDPRLVGQSVLGRSIDWLID